MRRILLVVVALLFVQNIYGQKIKKFSENPEDYLKELTTLLEEVGDKKIVEPLLLEFSPMWTGGSFTPAQQEKIYDISNGMLRKRIVEYKVWENLIKTMMFLAANESEENVNAWMQDLAEFIKKNPSKFSETYIKVSRLCFEKETLFDDDNLKWLSRNGVWEFNFDKKPTFVLTDVDIWGYFKTDSTVIEKTSGVFDLQTLTFHGNGGRVYWRRAGLSADTMYADMKSYKIKVDQTSFEADSVTLNTLLYLKEPMEGHFEERLSSRSEEERASFPRFVSYRDDFKIADFIQGVDFEGGFSVVGRKFYASGNAKKAKLTFKYENKPKVSLSAYRIRLQQEQFSSDAVEVNIKMGESDSLTHPKSSFKYITAEKRLILNRETEGMSQAPFIDTYHNLDIFMEELAWVTTEPQFFMSNLNLGAESPVIFESNQYYRGERFAAIQGLQDVNPLYNVKAVADAYGREMDLKTMAQGLGMSPQACDRFLMIMAINGYVDYDIETKQLVVKDKLYDYINNYEEKRDYDVIRFVSSVSNGRNASISLLNNDMRIVGIQGIALSDSQQVAMFPAQREIIVHEGLDFTFDGLVQAGRFSFWGKKYFFDYDLFQLNMASIDSMRFKVESFEADAMGRRKLVNVKNTLQNINGELLIDKPNNKSGKIRYTDYPIFRSGRESYVYYDRKETFNSVYDRQRFYVEIDPFEIDSLDNTSTQGLKFDGTFVSANIFPEMRQVVTVQEDYSLGFKATTGPEGLPAYGGKGRFTSDFALSNKGLRGNGTIDYVFSQAVSEDFMFFPDSTNGMADYEIQPKMAALNNPHAIGTGVWINWRPYQDVFYATSRATPFAMYDEIGMTMNGQLAYSPNSLKGNGQVDYLLAQNNSKEFVFRNREFTSQVQDFRVKARPELDWGFSMTNVRGKVNFDAQKGDFTLNDPAMYASFPINQYQAYMDHADWLIPKKAVEVKKLGGGALSRMLSVNRDQDSLQFDALAARFQLEQSLLEAFEVPHIDVADSRVFPDSGYVAIDPKADMRELTNAKLTANRYTKYHNFFNAKFKITSRKKFKGSGDLEYVDRDGTPWPLFFHKIDVDTTGVTYAKADVKEEEDFFMSPFFAYYGFVELRAPLRPMTFDGYTLIQQSCSNITTSWVKFKSEIDPKKIIIDLPLAETGREVRVFNGIYLAPDSTSAYTAFLSKESDRADVQLIAADGVLYYDEAEFSYVITTRNKLNNPDATDNVLKLNNRDCIVTGTGKLGIGDNTGRVGLEAYGDVIHVLNEDKVSLKIALAVDFFFSEEVMKGIGESLQANSSLAGADIQNPYYKEAMNYMLDDRDRKKYFEEISNLGSVDKIPKELRKTFFFSNVNLVWNQELSSFVSEGDLGLSSMGTMPINKKLDGIIEIRRKKKGDEVYIYFDAKKEYFFQYRRNLMQFYSSDQAMMDLVLQVESDKRSLDAENGLPRYNYNNTTKGKLRLFLQRFEE